MKIEKVSDNQIRCTLTSDDLADRQIKLSELVYGSDKTKKLFRDMMQQAASEFGFEAEDIPLMIEAIPINSGCLVLVITKVEDPEELDTRFSSFAPSILDEDDTDEEDSDCDDFAPIGESEHPLHEVGNLLKRVKDAIANSGKLPGKLSTPQSGNEQNSILYRFDSLSALIRVASVLDGCMHVDSSLYKDASSNQYLLIVSRGSMEAAEFNRICNTLSEYGAGQRLNASSYAFLNEHSESLISKNALEALIQMK